MQTTDNSGESRFGWLISIVQGLAWLVTGAGAIVDAIYIREGLLRVLAWFRATQLAAFHANGGIGNDLGMTFRLTAVDFLTIFILACGAVVAIVWIEYFYRMGRPKGLLWKRLFRVVVVEAAIILVSTLIQFFL